MQISHRLISLITLTLFFFTAFVVSLTTSPSVENNGASTPKCVNSPTVLDRLADPLEILTEFWIEVEFLKPPVAPNLVFPIRSNSPVTIEGSFRPNYKEPDFLIDRFVVASTIQPRTLFILDSSNIRNANSQALFYVRNDPFIPIYRGYNSLVSFSTANYTEKVYLYWTVVKVCTPKNGAELQLRARARIGYDEGSDPGVFISSTSPLA